MSTSFVRVCRECLAGSRHFHPQPETQHEIVAHRWFGGSDIGVQITVSPNVTIADFVMQEGRSVVDLDGVISIFNLLEQSGKGKKRE